MLNGPGVGSVSSRRRFAIAVMARETLRDAAELLGAKGIPLMPLKGVLFQQLLYRDPADRLLSDVDVLVPQRRFADAISTLLRGGFEPEKAGRSLIEVALRSRKGLSIDLHQRLFSPGRYSLSTSALFRRATVDTEWLGVPLHLPDPHDVAAHLIGKIVSDHVTTRVEERLRELLSWCERYGIDAEHLSHHLVECGLGRAARYTLELGIERLGAPFFRAALDALPPDVVGRACVSVAKELIPRLNHTPFAPLPAHLLNHSLVRSGASLGVAAFNRLRHARLARALGEGGGLWEPFFRR